MSRRKPQKSEPEMELSPAGKAVLAGFAIVGGVLLVLFAFGLTSIAMQALVGALRAGDIVFVIGAVLLALLAIVAVTTAGASLLRGLPFHLAGIVGPYFVGQMFPPLDSLQVAGGVIYAAAWCWTYLGETLTRFLRGRSHQQG